MNRVRRVYLGIALTMVLFLAVFGFFATPLTEEARLEESPALSLLLVLMFLVPFFILAWSLTNLIGWPGPGRGNRMPLT